MSSAMADRISGGRWRGRLPGRHIHGHQLLLWPDPGLTWRNTLEAHRPDHQGLDPSRPVRLQRPLQQAAPREHLVSGRSSNPSAAHIPGRRVGGDLRLLHRQHPRSCIRNPSHRYIRAKALLQGYWDRVSERNAPDASPYRAGFAQTICVAETDEEAERLNGLQRALLRTTSRLSSIQAMPTPGYRTISIHPDRRTFAIRAAQRFRRADLEGPDRGRPCDRRLAGDRPSPMKN